MTVVAILAVVLGCLLAPEPVQAAPGLPWFTSDRLDVYRGGTNDVPWTYQFGLADTVTMAGATRNRYVYYGVGGQVNLVDVDGSWYVAAGQYWDASTNAMTLDENGEGYAVAYGVSANPLREPFGFLMEFDAATPTLEFMQAEWIEPSLQCMLDHWYAGVLVGIPIDLSILLLNVLMRPVLQFITTVAPFSS